MKTKFVLLTVLCMIVVSVCFTAFAENTQQARNIILLTEYQQMGWGERFQLGALDDQGILWTFGSSTREDIPYESEALVAWAESSDRLEAVGSIPNEALTDIISLVETVPAQKVVSHSYACDTGTQTSYAVRKGRQNKLEIIVLGMAGDETFENTDPAAQSLYKALLSLFRSVTSYAGEEHIAPAGFRTVDILTFCGYHGVDLTKYTMTAYANDCETGASETEPELSAEDIMSMRVTGKQNSMATTGNTVTYCFTDPDGTLMAAFEFYNGLLVCSDGMYTVN